MACRCGGGYTAGLGNYIECDCPEERPKTTIDEMKERIYPERKARAMQIAELYLDGMIKVVDEADENEAETVTIPFYVARDICDALAFVSRLESYGK
jgi:hypothetical protein